MSMCYLFAQIKSTKIAFKNAIDTYVGFGDVVICDKTFMKLGFFLLMKTNNFSETFQKFLLHFL